MCAENYWLDQSVHRMNNEIHTLADQWYRTFQSQGRKDIAIVAQGFQEFGGGTLDMSFFSKLDCFHPSVEAHQDLAIALWNSMLCMDSREDNCGRIFQSNMDLLCPTVNSRFYSGPDVRRTPSATPPSLTVE